MRTIFHWLDGTTTVQNLHGTPPVWEIACMEGPRPRLVDFTDPCAPRDMECRTIRFERRSFKFRGETDTYEYFQLPDRVAGKGKGALADAIATVLEHGGKVAFG